MNGEKDYIDLIKKLYDLAGQWGDYVSGRGYETCLALREAAEMIEAFKMRDATPKEREAINSYIEKISRPTGFNFYDEPWIPVKFHEITEQEREKEELPSEWTVLIDSKMPEDGQEILVTVKHTDREGTVHYYVEKDICYLDDGCYLDSGYDWITDIAAWKPLPKPYIG
jgi:hypothetical protein